MSTASAIGQKPVEALVAVGSMIPTASDSEILTFASQGCHNSLATEHQFAMGAWQSRYDVCQDQEGA